MKWIFWYRILNAAICVMLVIRPATAFSEDEKNGNRFTRAIGIAAKYDSNINLTPGTRTNAPTHDLGFL